MNTGRYIKQRECRKENGFIFVSGNINHVHFQQSGRATVYGVLLSPLCHFHFTVKAQTMIFIKSKIFFPVLFLSLLLSCSEDTGNGNGAPGMEDSERVVVPERVGKPPFSASAAEVCAEFTSNSTNAVNKYRGSEVELSGTVHLAKPMVEDNCNYITLSCGADPRDTLGLIIKCCLKNPDRSTDTIRTGSFITIRARFIEFDQNILLFEEVDKL